MKCDACGIESNFDAGFIKERKSFQRTSRIICPACWVRRRQAGGTRVLWWMLASGLAGSVILWIDRSSHLGRLLLSLFLIELFLILTIIPHELGHAVVARLSGWRVFRIVIGFGKPFFKGCFLGFMFEFRRLPFGGVTLTTPIEWNWYRLKRFAIVLAGPTTNAAMAIATILLWQTSLRNFDFWALPLAPRLFIWANACVLVANLWPRQIRGGLNVASDGKQLLQILSFKKVAMKELRVGRFLMEAMSCREEGDYAGTREWCDKGLASYPEAFPLLNLSGINYLDEQQYALAREIFLKLLAKEIQPGLKRYLVLNNVAYASALAENPEWLPEADTYSNEAFTGLGWVPSIIGTRGTVLVAMGNFEEGIKLLKESLQTADSARSKAENACHLAIACGKCGNQAEAQMYLELARRFDSKCRLIARAEREVVAV